jgi:Rrf2 family protein
MKLTRASSYALIAVVYIAQQKSTKPVASHNIAKERGIPDRFLLKVLKPLVNARVLRSVKGPNGGYELAKPISEINMLEVIEAVDGRIYGKAEPPPADDGKKNGKKNLENIPKQLYSRLKNICEQTAEQTRRHLEKVMVSDLLKK